MKSIILKWNYQEFEKWNIKITISQTWLSCHMQYLLASFQPSIKFKIRKKCDDISSVWNSFVQKSWSKDKCLSNLHILSLFSLLISPLIECWNSIHFNFACKYKLRLTKHKWCLTDFDKGVKCKNNNAASFCNLCIHIV